jgi:sugar lactone lactonase YvrE
MSFMVAEDGRVYVLDQTNQRVQIFENGKFSRAIEIPGETFQDLAVDENGRIVLLDRLAQKAVVFLDPEQRIPLEGPRVPEGGGVTGMFINDGVWVEVEHQKLVRIADSQGNPDPDRPWISGRHSADGAWLLRAALDGRNAVNITLQPIDSAGAPVVRRVESEEKILFLTALESDPEGNIYLGARLEKSEVLVILKPDGSEAGRVALPAAEIELEQFRALRLGADGGMYQLHFNDSGARLRRIEW